MSKRYLIVCITSVAALWMYIDRVCVSTVAEDIQRDLQLSDWDKSFALGAFFVTYALFQIPVGGLADKFGPRLVLAGCILGWSVMTALTGLVNGLFTLLLARLLLGISEAGAYPAAANLVKRWARPEERGLFSSIVAAGGRFGGAAAPFMTRELTMLFAGVGLAWWTTSAGDDQPQRNWRAVFLLYGACGVALAFLFWVLVRDNPKIGPTDAAEEWQPPPPQQASLSFWGRIKLLARSRNMWLFGGTQFFVNVAWAFVVTKLPGYLKERGVTDREIGYMQTVVLLIGATGMLMGGFVTDLLRRRLGPKLGRSLPIGVALVGCSIACGINSTLSDPWAIVIFLGIMAMLVDVGNPAIWSFAQDVGGKNVGASLGWGNMWGNLGAAASPLLLTGVQKTAGWPAVFLFCACSFIAAACCALSLDATKPVDANDG